MSRKQPNILFLMTDQQRADTIGALGNAMIKTPNLDRLCAEGTSFLRAYTPAPICSPARVAMATGIEPHVHRFTDHDWWHWEEEGGPQVPSPHDASFMTACKEAGYQTFMTGKLHFHGRQWLTDGVDEYAGAEPQLSKDLKRLPGYGAFCREQGYPAYYDPRGRSSEYYYVPQTTPVPVEHSSPNFLADKTIEFFDRRDKDKPFLACVHWPDPHPPICNPYPWALLYRACEMHAPHRPENYQDYQARTNRYQNRYKGKETAQEDDQGFRVLLAAYYANISLIDYNIGRILDALGDEKDNTLIIFTVDHGDLMGDYGCVGKRCMLEGAIRIPFVACWAGEIPAGKVCRTPVSLMDVYPTILDAIGRGPETRCEHSDSLREIANAPDAAGERLVFSQFSSGWCGQYGVTDGQWKYFYSAPDNKEWLVNITDEVAEGANRAPDADIDAEAAEAKARLKGALMARHDPAVDVYSNAVENGDWKVHQPPAESYLDKPTYGLLCQESGEHSRQLQADMDALGPYARQVTGIQEGNMHKDHGVCGGDCPFGDPQPASAD